MNVKKIDRVNFSLTTDGTFLFDLEVKYGKKGFYDFAFRMLQIDQYDGDPENNKIEIIKVRGVSYETDFYYRTLVGGEDISCIADNEDVALLLGLQYKYQGCNSQFVKFACRMLEIDSRWAK